MRFSRLFLGCLMALALSGCAGYRLGPTNGLAAGEKSVRINPFSNHTMEPRLGDAVTSALRRNIQRDGTYEVATRDTADIVVTGVLKRYERHELSFVPKDVLTVRDYRVSVTAQVTARDTISGKTILDQETTGYTLVRVGTDLTSSERQAAPLLADDLAEKITALLVDGSW
jgi:hypothetical protein